MILNYVIVIVLILLSGLFSGLTLGLMGLSPFALKRKIKLGCPESKKIYPIRKQGNFLLVTLLLGNVAVNSTLAVFLGSITAGIIAGIVSTGLIVVFGEVLPQAFFSRHALKYGARAVWLVRMFMVLLYPVSKPLAWTLDKMLGGETPSVISRKEFALHIEEQKELRKSDLTKESYTILEGGLVLPDTTVGEVMTSWKNTVRIGVDQSLTRSVLASIYHCGHSRIPVYDKKKKKVVGILYAKDLITLSPADRKPVRGVMRRTVHSVRDTARLDKILSKFKGDRVHLYIVLDRKSKVVGILTLEDVLEEIVGEIVDEYDGGREL